MGALSISLTHSQAQLSWGFFRKNIQRLASRECTTKAVLDTGWGLLVPVPPIRPNCRRPQLLVVTRTPAKAQLSEIPRCPKCLVYWNYRRGCTARPLSTNPFAPAGIVHGETQELAISNLQKRLMFGGTARHFSPILPYTLVTDALALPATWVEQPSR